LNDMRRFFKHPGLNNSELRRRWCCKNTNCKLEACELWTITSIWVRVMVFKSGGEPRCSGRVGGNSQYFSTRCHYLLKKLLKDMRQFFKHPGLKNSELRRRWRYTNTNCKLEASVGHLIRPDFKCPGIVKY